MSPDDRQKYINLVRENAPSLCAEFDQGFETAFETISDFWDKYHNLENIDPQDAESIYFDLCETLERHCSHFANDGEQVVEFLLQGHGLEMVQTAVDRGLETKAGETKEILRIVLHAAIEQANNFGNALDFVDEFADVLEQAFAGDENYKRIKQDYYLTLR